MEQQDKPTEGLTVTDDNKGQIQETSKPDYSYEEKTECPLYLKVSFLVVFFMTGITNHLGTVLILTGSRNLCVELGKENFMGFYTIATIICSSVKTYLLFELLSLLSVYTSLLNTSFQSTRH